MNKREEEKLKKQQERLEKEIIPAPSPEKKEQKQ